MARDRNSHAAQERADPSAPRYSARETDHAERSNETRPRPDTAGPATEATSVSPTVRRRVLANELKVLRHAAGLTHMDVAVRLGWQQGKVSKIENASQGLGIDAVIALAEVYGAEDQQRDRLVELARAARSRGWWERYGDFLSGSGRTYIGLETEADAVFAFAVEALPDLVQIPEYALAVERSRAASDQWGVLERRVDVLLERQRTLLFERKVKLDVVLSESSLRRQVGGAEVFRAQLARLAELAAEPNLSVRVLPFSAGVPPVESSFVLLGFDRSPHPDVAFLPGHVRGAHFESEQDVATYRGAADALGALSLGEAESAELVDRLREQVAG